MKNYLFEQVRDRIPPDAHTVFTGPDEAGAWKVFVAKGERVVALARESWGRTPGLGVDFGG